MTNTFDVLLEGALHTFTHGEGMLGYILGAIESSSDSHGKTSL